MTGSEWVFEELSTGKRYHLPTGQYGHSESDVTMLDGDLAILPNDAAMYICMDIRSGRVVSKRPMMKGELPTIY